MGLDLCYEKLIFIFHIEKITLFFIFEVQKIVFHSLDLNPSAGIVHHIEPCMDFGTSFWYLFATITTIGFGDVIAGTKLYEECSDESIQYIEDDFYHQNNFFWVMSVRLLSFYFNNDFIISF